MGMFDSFFFDDPQALGLPENVTPDEEFQSKDLDLNLSGYRVDAKGIIRVERVVGNHSPQTWVGLSKENHLSHPDIHLLAYVKQPGKRLHQAMRVGIYITVIENRIVRVAGEPKGHGDVLYVAPDYQPTATKELP